MEKSNEEKAINAVKRLTGNGVNLEYIYTLYERWQDEKKFEDFSKYDSAIKKSFNSKTINVIKATKRPFGFIMESFGLRFKLSAYSTGKVTVEMIVI